MKVLMVSERCSSFLRNYLLGFASALTGMGAHPLVLGGEPFSAHGLTAITTPTFSALAPVLDEHRYLEAFRVAREHDANHLHFCFLTDPQRLYLALATDARAQQLSFTYSIFGLAEYLRKPICREFHERLLQMECIRRVLVHSIYPDVARTTAAEHGILQSPKVAYVHDPVYDDPGLFEVDKLTARAELGLPLDKRLALYFGTFSHKKGPDLLLAASRHLVRADQVRVVLAGNARNTQAGLLPRSLPGNVLLDDRFIDDAAMGRYFAAADLVVQPYRGEYEHDTSGVLVQAALAGRPVLVPDISPFRQTVREFGLGGTFSCGDTTDLARRIEQHLRHPREMAIERGKRYIQHIESWPIMAGHIIQSPGRGSRRFTAWHRAEHTHTMQRERSVA